jgi:hypothetical protein
MPLSFYKPSSQKKLKKFFRRNGFNIEEGAKHCIAIHNETGQVFVFPRHNLVSSGITQDTCKRLIELGYDEAEVRKILD